MLIQKLSSQIFLLPGIILILLIAGAFGVPFVLLIAVLIGIIKIVLESYEEIKEGRFSLDYIAFVAMIVSLISGYYIAGAFVALMFTGGKALEIFASERAYKTLKSLGDTIPKFCFVLKEDGYVQIPIQDVVEGEQILIKKNELIPLDGILKTKTGGSFALSNLTGESEPVLLQAGTIVKSGSVNIGDTAEIEVVGDFSSSTYHKIVQLVEDAHLHPARIVRVSEQANFYFTALAFVFAGVAYVLSGEITRSLAVLVIATPCPLIIAAPVAFIGGMSRLAKSGIIMRKPVAFEGIHKAKTIFFDKTGTLTMGEPKLAHIEILDKSVPELFNENAALTIAASIEIHSLHPLARALVAEASSREIAYPIANDVHEKIGTGISGTVGGKIYVISRTIATHEGIALDLVVDGKPSARFHFIDALKEGVADLLADLHTQGIETAIITGDRKENAEEVFKNIDVTVHAEVTPEDKYAFVKDARARNRTVVMVGDGLNDAPALALADVGVVFSGAENGASIETADVVILDAHIEKLKELFDASHKTMRIARQSIYGGIILSSVGMLFAMLGHIPPVTGAIIQEGIDVVVILNALRTLRG